MKTLILVRHAHALSAWEARVHTDGERPLSPEGLAKARAAAQEIARLGYMPETVFTSPLLRARQTAQTLSAALHAPLSAETVLNGLHTDEDALDFLQDSLQSQNCVLAVCHNPQISVLAQRLTRVFRPFHPGSFIALNMEDKDRPQVLHFGE